MMESITTGDALSAVRHPLQHVGEQGLVDLVSGELGEPLGAADQLQRSGGGEADTGSAAADVEDCQHPAPLAIQLHRAEHLAPYTKPFGDALEHDGILLSPARQRRCTGAVHLDGAPAVGQRQAIQTQLVL